MINIMCIICAPSSSIYIEATLAVISTLLVQTQLASTSSSALSPSEVASVCPGERLQFICHTTLDYIRWNVTVVQPRPDSRESELISNILNVSTTSSFPVNMIQFTVGRSSTAESNRSHPLISTLSVANVTTSLNGTKVKCATFSESVTNTTSTATIHVIQPFNSPTSPKLETFEVNYYETSIIVELGWTPEIGVSYNTVVEPQASVRDTSQTGNKTVQLTLDYNTPYKVCIVSTLCNRSSTTTTTVIDHYHFVKCNYPSIPESRVMITPDSNPALEGTNITFSCPLGMVLTGPTGVATCMRNGEWEPDPGRVQCKADCGTPLSTNNMYNSTLEGSLLTNPSIEFCSNSSLVDVKSKNKQDYIVIVSAALAGSITVTLVCAAIAVILIIAKYRGRWCGKKKLNCSGQNHDNKIPIETKQFSGGEYSLLQHSPPETTATISDSKSGTSQNKTLVYADVGAMTCRVQPYNIGDRVEYSQLNFCAQKSLLSTKQLQPTEKLHPADKILNLDSLLIQLKVEVTSQWYQLGEALGVDKTILEKCSQYPPEESIVEILDNWLRNHQDQPTWREVAETLKTIGFQQLGCDIENVYKTGKLPVDINKSWNPNDVLPESETELPPPLPPRLAGL